MLFTQSEVVFEVVALVFKGVEGFVLYLPACAATTHEGIDIVPGYVEVGDRKQRRTLSKAGRS